MLLVLNSVFFRLDTKSSVGFSFVVVVVVVVVVETPEIAALRVILLLLGLNSLYFSRLDKMLDSTSDLPLFC